MTDLRPRIEVEEGCVIINDIDLMIAHDNVFVYWADCRTKYSEILWHGNAANYGVENEGPQTVLIAVGKNERTLNLGPIDTQTIIKVCDLPPGRWHTEAYAARYSLYITLTRIPDEVMETAWHREEVE